MKEGAILLNTSRGDVVDEAALLDALETRALRAGLDVYPDEPGSGSTEWSSKLAQHPHVVGTHHIGASTAQAQKAVAEGVVEIIDAFVRGEIVNCVNLAPTRLGTHTLHVRHFDRVGVLAGVFDILRRRELNVEQMENRVFEGRNAAVATIDVVGDVGPGSDRRPRGARRRDPRLGRPDGPRSVVRVHNFCAGPCTLPLSVLEEVKSELLDFRGAGMSVIEMSHRSPEYEAVHEETLSLFRENYAVPEDFSILFLQGGATLQFADRADEPAPARESVPGYVRSGTWAQGRARRMRAHGARRTPHGTANRSRSRGCPRTTNCRSPGTPDISTSRRTRRSRGSGWRCSRTSRYLWWVTCRRTT